MVSRIVSFFIEKGRVGHLLLIFISLVGFLSYKATVNQGYPTVDFGLVTINTINPGASAEEMESDVTRPIEKEIKGIAGIDYVTSVSIDNVSQITIKLKDGYDFDESKEDIQKAVDRVPDLPAELPSKPIVFELNNDAIPVFEVAIHGPVSYKEKRFYADVLEQRLRTSSLVGVIEKVGYRELETQILLNPNQLKNKYVSLGEVARSIQAYNIYNKVGDLSPSPLEKTVLVDSEFKSLQDLKNVIIRSGFEGNRVKITDIATLKEGYADAENIIRFNGKNTITFFIQKKPDADITKTSKEIKAILTQLQTEMPETIHLDTIVDYSVDSNNLLKLVSDNAVVGLVLILITLVLLLNTKIALWTALGIPVAILIGFSFFPLFDVTINFISLIAILIVLGMLVDDAILVSENIFYYREQGYSAVEASIKGVEEVKWPVITTVSTTIIAFLPMLFMKGVMGKFMFVLPIVVTVVLLGSLIESLFILPFHLAHTAYKPGSKPIVNIFGRLDPLYKKLVTKCFQLKWLTLSFFIGLLGLAVLVSVTLTQFKLFPSDNGLMTYIQFETETGTPLEKTADMARDIEEIVSKYPEFVAAYITNIGERSPRQANNFVSSDSSSGFYGNIVMHMTAPSSREKTSMDFVKLLREDLKKVSGFKELKVDAVNDGPPVGRAVTVRFVSENDSLRNQYTDELKQFLKDYGGLVNIEDTRHLGKVQLTIDFNNDLMAQLGITPMDVSETLRTAFNGMIATKVTDTGEIREFRVRLADKYQTVPELLKLKIRNQYGKLIPLGQFIKLVEKRQELAIYHYDAERSSAIFADIEDSALSSGEINKAIMETFSPKLENTPSVRMFFGGEEKESQESMDSLFSALTLALIGIYFALVILFNSFSQPFLVMVSIPYSFSGVIFAFTLHNMPLSFPAMIGMIGLIGVVVNNSLVMISFLNSARVEGEPLNLTSMAEAATRRFRPIMLTTFTTAAALFPTAYGFGGDNPVIIPMVMALSWGLVFSTLISLFLIPTLFIFQYQTRDWIRAKLGR